MYGVRCVLYIDTVCFDVGEGDIRVCHVDNTPACVVVCLDAQTEGGICHNGVGEASLDVNHTDNGRRGKVGYWLTECW